MKHSSSSDFPAAPPPSRPSVPEEWGPLRPLDERAYSSPQEHIQKPTRASAWRRWGSLGALGLFFFGKLKWVAAGLKFAKVGPLLSMLATVWVYATFFGWPFAVGFVALIFVHEMGHALALKQQGIPSGAPVFIPFVGAFIAMRGRPRDAAVEAIVGIGGPVLGSVGAAACLLLGLWLHSDLLLALASVGFLLNLFNMIPISPLDGGRIAGAVSRWFWAVGYAVGIAAFFATGSPILFLILLVGLFTVWRSIRSPVPGYYAIPGWKRVAIGSSYFGLLALLALGMALADSRLEHLTEGAGMRAAGAGIYVFGGAMLSQLGSLRIPGRAQPATLS